MSRLRLIAAFLIAVGLIVPKVIYEYEVANHLDISRNVGSLPWLIMTIIGAAIFIYSFIKRDSK